MIHVHLQREGMAALCGHLARPVNHADVSCQQDLASLALWTGSLICIQQHCMIGPLHACDMPFGSHLRLDWEALQRIWSDPHHRPGLADLLWPAVLPLLPWLGPSPTMTQACTTPDLLSSNADQCMRAFRVMGEALPYSTAHMYGSMACSVS